MLTLPSSDSIFDKKTKYIFEVISPIFHFEYFLFIKLNFMPKDFCFQLSRYPTHVFQTSVFVFDIFLTHVIFFTSIAAKKRYRNKEVNKMQTKIFSLRSSMMFCPKMKRQSKFDQIKAEKTFYCKQSK